MTIKKFLFRGVLFIVGAVFLSHGIHTYSGSNQWELEGEKKGVTVYSLKSPGSNLKQFRGVVRVKSRLASFVAMMQGSDISDDTGFYEPREFDKDNMQLFHAAFKTKVPIPIFKPREFVVRNHFYQNPKSKTVYYEVTATPGKIPPDECCYRISDMNNYWVFTPLGNGEVELEWFINMDLGLPYFIINSAHPEYMYDVLAKMQGFLDREHYKNAQLDFIQEVES